MSRNFELIAQLELESAVRDKPRPESSKRTAAAEGVPDLSRRAASASAEEILRLVQRVFLSANRSSPRQVVLFGVDGENGSSSVCASAGRALAANSSRPVCMIDANVRSPRLSGIFGVAGTDAFCDPSAALREQCVNVGANLWLAGHSMLSDHNGILLPPDEIKMRLTHLRETFEFMLIDAPATGVCGDAQQLGLVADAAILVIEASSTRRLAARKAKESLEAAGIRLLGTVLCNRSFPIPEQLYKRL